jgi:hypothetical protein
MRIALGLLEPLRVQRSILCLRDRWNIRPVDEEIAPRNDGLRLGPAAINKR